MGAMNFYSLIGAVAFLALGILELAVLNRTLYPALRWRYEKAKLTQEQGIEPNRIMAIVKIQSLVIMPLLGLFLGKPLKSIFG
jgi:hypothetical protein